MSVTQIQNRTDNHFASGDADLLLRLRIALSVKKRAGWHLVSISVQDGAVQLAGIVPSYYDRQLIGSLVRHVAGVHRIDDNLAVGDPSIRQQVAAAAETDSKSDSTTNATSPKNAFAHLPVLPESLDDIVPVHISVVVRAA